MTGPRVLLLDASGPEATAITATATAAGYQVHAITHPTQHTSSARRLPDMLTGCQLTDLTRPSEALEDITGYARRIGADAVLTTNEYLTPLLAQVCAELGLPGNDPTCASAARNKATMSAAFAEHDVHAPRTHVVLGDDDIYRLPALRDLTFPCVVKPAEGAGSTGVTVVNDPNRLEAACRTARMALGVYGMPLDPAVLIQDYIRGTEFSVESFTQHGTTTHLCITTKTVTTGPYRVEIGHSLPTTLSPETEQNIHQQVQRAIDAVGIRNGASHTEVIVDDHGLCTVIEIGARLGAGHIGVLIQHALGINPSAALLDIALGWPAALTPTRRGYATIRFLTSPCGGRLRAISGMPTTGPGIPAVRVRAVAGERVEEPRASRGRLGHFIVTGPDPDTVERRAQQLLAHIIIDVEPESCVGIHWRPD